VKHVSCKLNLDISFHFHIGLEISWKQTNALGSRLNVAYLIGKIFAKHHNSTPRHFSSKSLRLQFFGNFSRSWVLMGA